MYDRAKAPVATFLGAAFGKNCAAGSACPCPPTAGIPRSLYASHMALVLRFLGMQESFAIKVCGRTTVCIC